MSKADFATRESIANLIINRVKLNPNKAIIEGIVPVVPDVLSSAHRSAPSAGKGGFLNHGSVHLI